MEVASESAVEQECEEQQSADNRWGGELKNIARLQVSALLLNIIDPLFDRLSCDRYA
jgi:hypothetical protein